MQLKLVSECLYRSRQGVYFALIKVRGKQIKRSLDTKDLTLAKRLLRDFKNGAFRLVLRREKTLFSYAADQWLAHLSPTLKPKSIARRVTSINWPDPGSGTIQN